MARHSLAKFDQRQVMNSRYCDIKQLAGDYMVAKNRLVDKLVNVGAGRWVEKPVEQDQFYMNQ